jgi:hypothetical protein
MGVVVVVEDKMRENMYLTLQKSSRAEDQQKKRRLSSSIPDFLPVTRMAFCFSDSIMTSD